MFILPEQSHDMWLMPLSSRTLGIALRQQLSSISYGSIKRIKQQYFRNARKSTIRLYLKCSLNLSLIRNPWAWCPSFWSQALCASARTQVTQTVHTRETEKEGEGKRANVNLLPSPCQGCVPAKLSHNLSASSQSQPYAHSHILPRTGPPPHQEQLLHSGIEEAANPTPKSYLSWPS